MNITKLVVRNFKALRNVDISLNPDVNIIVGDNAEGKSTILEAINLALTGQLDGKPAGYMLHPFLFNQSAVNEYLTRLKSSNKTLPPSVLIEVYFDDHPDLIRLKGSNNSRRENVPGVSVSIDYDPKFEEEYKEYIKDPSNVRAIPVEYYSVSRVSFASEYVTSRGIPVNSKKIDGSSMRGSSSTDRYLSGIVSGVLDDKQRAELALKYRKMKHDFSEDTGVQFINAHLSKTQGSISDKSLSVSLDTTSKSTWEGGLIPHLDDIPLSLEGRGEQNSIKIVLAMDAASKTNIFMVEEPENHLSHTNLNKLIKKIVDNSSSKQLIITTHNSFVLNKLGVDKVILFKNGNSMTLKELSTATHDYFMKLPGHDTLRLILAEKAILVEGPSDELIVQKAYKDKLGSLPIEKGVDVITVRSLAFKRFLDIAIILKINVSIVTDNDGDVNALQEKYKEYSAHHIRICYDNDPSCTTLEPQLLKANGLSKLNEVLGKNFECQESLLNFMKNNKTDCALKIFDSDTHISIPRYIQDAIV